MEWWHLTLMFFGAAFLMIVAGLAVAAAHEAATAWWRRTGTQLDGFRRENGKLRAVLDDLGPWLSAALDDERTCEEFKEVCRRALEVR